ncbi:MAG: RidA family protein [Bacteroidota bacterium]|nr:RidA family protein [Bacteroidota bacterium]
MRKIINTMNAPKAIGSYSQAVLVNNTLYCSGQIGIDPKTNNLIKNNISDETKRVIKNILAILDAANMNLENVVKTTIFIKDMKDYDIINNIYSKYFHKNPPARETVEVSKLPKDMNIEISIIAIKT